VVQSVDHILFNNPVAKFMWCVLRDYFGSVAIPRYRGEVIEFFLVNSNKVTCFWFSAVVWDDKK
jgi:hypothetical protein